MRTSLAAEGFSCSTGLKRELKQKQAGLWLGTVLLPTEGWKPRLG